MIERKKVQEVFKKYVAPYDVTNEKIALKIVHTYHTAQVAEKIAKSIGLDEENIELAWIIGLLHDIGRFEQLRIYNTFDDSKSIDHADFAVKLLFQEGLIRKFIKEDIYDDIIYKAIQNHNKYQIESELSKEEAVHAKIIRDADKTDIFRIHVEEVENKKNVLYNEVNLKTQKISPEVLETFLSNKLIDRKYVKNDIDEFVVNIAFIYDYNYPKGLEIIKEEKYIERIFSLLEGCKETEQQTKTIKQVALDFLEENIK